MATVGYSGKPLNVKIGVKPGNRIALINSPQDFTVELEPLPEGVELVTVDQGDIDIAILFCMRSDALPLGLDAAIPHIRTAGMIWVAWPKKSAKADTDLNDGNVRDIGLETGWVDVKVCAVTEYWSGLKFVRRLKDRKPSSA